MNNSAPTITLEFGLYCENAWKKGLLGTSFFAIATIFSLVFGIASNKYGRKIVIIVALFFGSLSFFTVIFYTNYWLILVFYSFGGMLIPFYNFSTLLCNEIGDSAYRDVV